MYDFLCDCSWYCGCCQTIQTDIKNKQNLTPLTLAAKIGQKEVRTSHCNLLVRANCFVFIGNTCAFGQYY